MFPFPVYVEVLLPLNHCTSWLPSLYNMMTRSLLLKFLPKWSVDKDILWDRSLFLPLNPFSIFLTNANWSPVFSWSVLLKMAMTSDIVPQSMKGSWLEVAVLLPINWCVKYLTYEGAFESMNRRYEASGICVKNLSLNGAIKN